MDKQNQFDAQQQNSQNAGRAQVPPPEDKQLSSPLPKNWHTRRENDFNSSVYVSILVEQRTQLLVRLLGVGLLVFTLVDYIYIFIPPQFTNPSWEFQTIGALVEHAVFPLLGLIFVFYRHEGYIGKLEKNLLGFLSWVSLLVGLLYLLMLPLGVADTWRIYHANNAQIASQLSQQSQQLEQIKEQLNQATTDEQLGQLAAALTPQSRSPQIKNTQEFKDQLQTQISQSERSMQLEADKVRSAQRQTLIKNSVKWNLGALIAATLFILIWHLTDWARIRQY